MNLVCGAPIMTMGFKGFMGSPRPCRALPYHTRPSQTRPQQRDTSFNFHKNLMILCVAAVRTPPITSWKVAVLAYVRRPLLTTFITNQYEASRVKQTNVFLFKPPPDMIRDLETHSFTTSPPGVVSCGYPNLMMKLPTVIVLFIKPYRTPTTRNTTLNTAEMVAALNNNISMTSVIR